jgi:CubicO group peptidase (beta-lactamase class C family)
MLCRPALTAACAIAALLLAPLSPLGAQRAAPAAAADRETPARDPRFAAVADTIRRLIAEEGVPSVTVAVAQRGRIVWEEGFGHADLARRRAATPRTLYSLASITKPFTATALMTLVERGTVSLDAPVNRYLGTPLTGLAGPADSATLARLLTHTAGLPLHYQFFYEGGPAPADPDESVRRHGIVVLPPGERFFYSNFGFGLLDHVIARQTGGSFARYVRDAVLLPLGLHDSSVGLAPEQSDMAAVRYDQEGRPIPYYTFDHVGASAMWASAHDLVRFGMFHLGHPVPGARRVLRAETLARMQRSHAATDVPGSSRGLGWALLEDDNGYRRVSHTGSMPGVATALHLYPAEEVALVVLVNQSGFPTVPRVMNALAAAVLPRFAAVAAERRAARAAAPASARAGTDGTLAGRWRGRLRTPDDSLSLALDVRPDGHVHVRLGDQLETVLAGAATQGGVLTGQFAGVVRTPDTDRQPHVITLTLRRRGDRLDGWASAIGTGAPTAGAVSFWVRLEQDAGRDGA